MASEMSLAAGPWDLKRLSGAARRQKARMILAALDIVRVAGRCTYGLTWGVGFLEWRPQKSPLDAGRGHCMSGFFRLFMFLHVRTKDS